MNLREILRSALESINANRLRSLLTMLGVIIGVAAVIMMVAISAGTEATIADQIDSLGSNLLFVMSSMGAGRPNERMSSVFLTMDDMQAILEEVPNVTGVATDRGTSATVKAGEILMTEVSIVGTTPGYADVRDVPVESGRFISDEEVDRASKVAVLGAALAEQLFGAADPVGQSITVGTARLTVIGVAAPKGVVGNTDYDEQLYAPLTLVNKKFLPSRMIRMFGDRVGAIYVEVAPEADKDVVSLKIQKLLARRHEIDLADLPFTVSTQEDIVATQAASTEAFRSLLAWVAGVSLVVGGIGIMNIMLVSVTERTREIGIRQAVGASPMDIRAQFLAEALVMSLVGGLIGVIAGVGGSMVFNLVGAMRTVIIWSSVLLAFASAALVGVFFGYYPANKAALLDPIQALHYE
jgi:putative ABC transport system permease protein